MTDIEQLITQCNLGYTLYADVCNNLSDESYAVFTYSDIRPTDFTDGKAQCYITSFNFCVYEKGHKKLVQSAETINSKLVNNGIAVLDYRIGYYSDTNYSYIQYSCSV